MQSTGPARPYDTPLVGLRAYSTGGVVALSALFRGVSVDNCLAGIWFSSPIFEGSYLRGMIAVSHSVDGPWSGITT